jgi:archaemetzincin
MKKLLSLATFCFFAVIFFNVIVERHLPESTANSMPGFLDSRDKVIYITTMGDISPLNAQIAKRNIEKFYGIDVIITDKSELPGEAWCDVRKRYVASDILHNLKGKDIAGSAAYNYKVLALTDKDVETENGRHWGVMGLAFLGGDQCVVSTYRMKGMGDRFQKVTLHEVGHMLDIDHCKFNEPSCFMNDAKGKGSTVDRANIYLCDGCRAKMDF